MSDANKSQMMLFGAILAIVIAVAIVIWQFNRPAETINKFEDVPPKGAGKFDRKS